MSITNIDFHIDTHIIQVGQGVVRIFIDGCTKKPPIKFIEFNALELERILRVSSEQLDGHV